MQSMISNPNLQNQLEFLKSLLEDSIKQLLVQYRSGRNHFFDFDSIFTRILNDLPNPPLELVWFYSAVRFYSSKLAFRDDFVRLTSSFFQLLVSFSDSYVGAKRIALLSPVVYQLSRVVVTKESARRDALSLLEGIVSYISMCCVEGPGNEDDDVLMVLGFSFADLTRVWVIDEVGENCTVEDCLGIFTPFVSERVRKVMNSESCRVGYLAGVVACQVFLLTVCLKFNSESTRSELEKDLQRSVLRMISGFQSYYFFDVILKLLLLEPHLHLTSLLGPEDEATLLEIITEVVIKSVENLFLNPENGTSQQCLHLKNIAISWLFLIFNAMASLSRNKDQAKSSRNKDQDKSSRNKDQDKSSKYMNIFSNSRIPYLLINWVISQGEVIRDANSLRNLTPASFIEWLGSLEEQGLRVFNCDHSKTLYTETMNHRSRTDLTLKTLTPTHKNADEKALMLNKLDQDTDMTDHIASSLSILTSNTRKRREERHKEGDRQMKLFKQEHNKFQPFEVEVADMEL